MVLSAQSLVEGLELVKAFSQSQLKLCETTRMLTEFISVNCGDDVKEHVALNLGSV